MSDGASIFEFMKPKSLLLKVSPQRLGGAERTKRNSPEISCFHLSGRRKTVSALLLATALWAAGARAQNAAPIAIVGAPLSLNGALTGALSANPTARASQQEFALATAQLARARAAAGFSVTLDSSVGLSNANVIQGPPSRENFNTLTNTLTVPLNVGPFGRRAKLSVAQAQQELLAAGARFEAARLSLAGEVNAAYYNVLRGQALLQIARETEAQAVRQYQDAGKRFKLGDAPELDVIRARVPVAGARAAEVGALNSLAIARQTLNVLVGQPLDSPVDVEEVPLAATALPFTLEEARARAIEFSPAVRAADATVKAGELGLQIAKHGRDPVLALQASDIRSNDQTGFRSLDTVQATISIPLSDGGAARAARRGAQATLEGAKAQAEIARQTTLVAVSAAYLTAQSSQKQLDAARQARDIAQIAYDKTARGYTLGLFPFADVLTAQTELRLARTLYAQTLYDAANAVATLGNTVNQGATTLPAIDGGNAPTVVAPTAGIAATPSVPTTPAAPVAGVAASSGTAPLAGGAR